MAVTWGPARTTATNGFRVGLELRSSGSGSSRTVHWEIWLWTRRAAYNTSSNYSLSGAVSRSGSFGFNHSNNSSDWPTSNRTRIASGSFTRTLNYGSSQSVSLSGSVSGISAVPGTASHSRSITLPARSYNTPAAPTGAYVYPSSNYRTAELRWTRNSTSSAPWEKVQVQRRHLLDDGTWASWTTQANLSGNATSYVNSVNDNWHYHYRVRAGNSTGWSSWLDMGRLNTTPATPTTVTARHSGTSIRLTWNLYNRLPTGNLRTRVERSVNGGTWATAATLSGAPTTWTHTNVDPASTYRYRVRLEVTQWGDAVGAYGTSGTVQIAVVPNAPTDLGPTTPTPEGEAATVTWRYVAQDGSEQTAYQIRYRRAGISSWTTMAEVNSEQERHTFPTLPITFTAGDTLEWQVRTRGSHPTIGPWSNTARRPVVARPTVAINSPEEGAALESSEVEVTWAYSGPGSQAAWRFRLYREDELFLSRSGNNAQSSVHLTNLENDTGYRVEVEVQSGDGLWSVEPDSVDFSTAFLPPPTPSVQDIEWDIETGANLVTINVPPWTDGAFIARENLIRNPSFENGTAGVTGSGQYRLTSSEANVAVGNYGLEFSGYEWDGEQYVAQMVDLPEGSYNWWVATSLVLRRTSDAATRVQVYFYFYSPGETEPFTRAWVGAVNATAAPLSQQTRHRFRARIPTPATRVEVRVHADLASPSGTGEGFGLALDAWMAAVEDSELKALGAVESYFDGDSATQGLTSYLWTDRGTSVEAVANSSEPVYLRLERSINGGPWVVVADHAPLDTAITDPLPAIGDGNVNRYRAIAYSAMPSSAMSPEAENQILPNTRDSCPVPAGRNFVDSFYLNRAEDPSRVARAVYEPEVDHAFSKPDTVLHRFSGRKRPLAFYGEGEDEKVGTSFVTLPEEEYRGVRAATFQQWLALVREPGPFIYRDWLGRRFWVDVEGFDGARTPQDHMACSMSLVRLEDEEA